MKTKLIRIGNSRGVRIPKPLLEQSGLEGEVRLRVVEGGILVEAEKSSRAGWSAAAAEAHERGDDHLLEQPLPTQFDDSEWEWEWE
jgi:antitoxin MazE